MRIIAAILICSSLAACGAWKAEKVEADTAERIDRRLTTGMSVEQFLEVFPDAMPIDEEPGTFVVAFQEPCFWCRSAQAFRASRNTWSRVVVFDDGRLARIEATQ